MKFQKAALIFAVLTVGGYLAAQEAEKERQVPRPSDVGRTEKNVEFRVPDIQPITLREVRPLKVERFEVHELAEGSHAGETGDPLLTFHGQGFLATSKSPQVVLAGGKVVLVDTLMNLEGTQLFVVISREMRSKIEVLDLEEVIVVNPGGRQDTKYGHVSVAARVEDLLHPEKGAPKARLLYEKGEFVRYLVGG